MTAWIHKTSNSFESYSKKVFMGELIVIGDTSTIYEARYRNIATCITIGTCDTSDKAKRKATRWYHKLETAVRTKDLATYCEMTKGKGWREEGMDNLARIVPDPVAMLPDIDGNILVVSEYRTGYCADNISYGLSTIYASRDHLIHTYGKFSSILNAVAYADSNFVNGEYIRCTN